MIWQMKWLLFFDSRSEWMKWMEIVHLMRVRIYSIYTYIYGWRMSNSICHSIYQYVMSAIGNFAEFTNIILNEVNRTKWCCFAFDLTDGACCRTSKPYLKVLIFFIQTYAKECDCDSIYSQCTVSKYEMDVLWHMSIESVSVVCIIDTTRHTCYITTRTFWRQSVHHK